MFSSEENEHSKVPEIEGTRTDSDQTKNKSPTEFSKLEEIEESESKKEPLSLAPVQDREGTVASTSEQQDLAMNPYQRDISSLPSHSCTSGFGEIDPDDDDDNVEENSGDKVHEPADKQVEGDGGESKSDGDDSDDEELSRILFNELAPQRRRPSTSSEDWRSLKADDSREDSPLNSHLSTNTRASFIRHDVSPEGFRRYDSRFDCRGIGRCWNQRCRCGLVDVNDRYMHPSRAREGSNSLHREEEIDLDLHPEIRVVGAGLENMGNTCFINAVLQCFTHTVPVVQGLRSFNEAESRSDDCQAFCVLHALRSHIERSLAYAGRAIRPDEVVYNLHHISSLFQGGRQEDAHEFLQCLLDKLDNCWSKHDAHNMLPINGGLVQQVFGGSLISQLRCCKCGHISNTREPTIDLSLEIEDVDNLDNALQSFTSVEKIEEDVKVTCESCKEQVPVEKQLMLEKLPNIAVLHLKRFKSDGGKNYDMVKYPSELNLKPYTTPSADDNSELMYELYGVVVHIGVSFGGHYYSYIKSAPDSWYLFDDKDVKKVAEEFVLSQEAYILFYKRKGTPWFSSLMENSKSCLEKDISNTSPKSVLDTVGPVCTEAKKEDLFGCKAVESKEDQGGDSVRCFSGPTHDNIVRETAKFQAEELPRAGQLCDDRGIRVDESDPLASTGVREPSCWLSRMGVKNKMDDIEAPQPMDMDALYHIKAREEKFVAAGTTEAAGRSSVDGRTCDHEMNLASCSSEVLSKSASKEADMCPSTPPRSPSPDIYSEEPEEVIFHSAPTLKSKRERTPPSKKSVNKAKAMSEIKKKEAAKYVRRMMPSGRSKHFMAIIQGDGSPNKKKRNASLPTAGRDPKSRKTTSPTRSMMRPVAAGVGR